MNAPLTRTVHGREVDVEMNPRVRSWAYILNTSLHRYGWMGDAQETAKRLEYPFFVWSGWVYNSQTGQHTGWTEQEILS